MRILVVDNHDSFVYNLVQYLGQLGARCEVRRADELTLAGVARLRPAGILLSPGPGTPQRAGICLPLLARFAGAVPILGVCLGHQAIGVAFGAELTGAPRLSHGQTAAVTHTGAGVLAGLPDPFQATRYHSLTLAEPSLPPELEITARTADPTREVMAVRHRALPVEGVQFHPEAVLTEAGHVLLANWLAGCGLPAARDRAPALAAEVAERRRVAFSPA